MGKYMAERRADLVVIGAGVAGLAAATLAARHGLTTICAEGQMFGGLVLNIGELHPAPASRPAQGADLAAGLMEEAEAAGAVYSGEEVHRLTPDGPVFRVETAGGDIVARTVVIASGARLRPLDVPGEKEFENRGVAHCADCDAAFYAGRDVVVAGGGDSALQEALVLARQCKTVFIVHRDAALNARRHFVDAVLRQSNIQLVSRSTVREIRGSADVEAVVLRDDRGFLTDVPCAGVFPYIGLQPNTSFLPVGMQCDEQGFLLTNNQLEASLKGAYAIGAVRSGFSGTLDDAFADARRVVEVLQSTALGGDA
jgi:thioredoxin reductase (NADPH)